MEQRKPAKPGQSVDRNHEIHAAYSQQVMGHSHASRWFTSTIEFTPKLVARIHHYLVGVNRLGYSEWIDFTDFS
jgi:hypothetical protein